MVRMVLEIIKDMRYFLLLLAYMVLGFGSAFFLLFSIASAPLTADASVAFSDVHRTLVTMLAAMVASYEPKLYYEARVAWLAVTLLVIYVVVMVVVLLNLLINIMGGSYERVSLGHVQGVEAGRVSLDVQGGINGSRGGYRHSI